MSFGEILQNLSNQQISIDTVQGLCSDQGLNLTELFFKCSSFLQLRVSLKIMMACIADQHFLSEMSHFPLNEIYADTLISIPSKVANSYRLDQSLSEFFWLALTNEQVFTLAVTCKYLKRLFLLGEYRFLLGLRYAKEEIWNHFLSTLNTVEIVHFVKRAIDLHYSIGNIVECFEMNDTVLSGLIELQLNLSVRELVLLLQPGNAHVFKCLIDRFWRYKSFATRSNEKMHFQICMCINICWILLEESYITNDKGSFPAILEATKASLFKGIDYHLDSSSKENRIIAMVFAQRLSKGDVMFGLDDTDPEIHQWIDPRTEKQIPVSLVPSVQYSIPSNCEHDLCTIVDNLKIKEPVFIGEVIQMFAEKKDRSTIELVLSKAQSTIEKCHKTEIEQHFPKLLQIMVHLRDDFEIESFLERKHSLISLLIRKDTVRSITYICTEIFSISLNDGDRLFLFDIILNLLKDSKTSEVSSVEKKENSLVSSIGKVHCFAPTSLRLRNIEKSNEIDPFLTVFIPTAFHSLLNLSLFNGARNHERKVSKIVYERLLIILSCLVEESIKLPCAQSIHSDFGTNVVSKLSLLRDTDVFGLKVVAYCFYSYVFFIAPESILFKMNVEDRESLRQYEQLKTKVKIITEIANQIATLVESAVSIDSELKTLLDSIMNVSGFTMLLVLFFISALCPRFFCVPDAYLDGGVKTGDATFYNEWFTNHGSCGTIPKSGFYVAALSSKYMALPSGLTNPNKHPLCGLKYCILASGPNGAMVVKVSDTCGGCPVGLDDVDFADTVFKNIANPKDGRVKITWKFVDCNKYKPGVISRDEADKVLSGKVTPATNEKENEAATKTAKKDTSTPNGVKRRKPKSGTLKSALTNDEKSEVKKQTKSSRTRNAAVLMAKASSPIAGVHSEDSNGDEPSVQTSNKIKRTPAVAEKPRNEVVMTEIIDSEAINLPENADDAEAQVINERSAAKPTKPTIQTPLLADAQQPPRNFASIDLASLDPTRNEQLKAIVSDPDVGNLYKSLQFSILYYLKEIGKLLAGKSNKKIKFVNKIPSTSNTKSEE